jgi:GNAT superfamily N-acetyltransferase
LIYSKRNAQELAIPNLPDMSATSFTVRPFLTADRPGVRQIYGQDEFARPRLLGKYPRMSQYLADEASCYYTGYEPETLLVAEAQGAIVGALLGAVNTERYRQIYKRCIRPMLIRQCLSGAYGFPIWYLAVLKTDIASRNLVTPEVDLHQYPAHLHIGVLADWRRRGIGTNLMQDYEETLHQKKIPGYHLYASSFHPMGVAFYRKLSLEDLGQFNWRFHDGYKWSTVTEYIFGKRLNPPI